MKTMAICYYTSSVLYLSTDRYTLTLAWQTYAIISADYHIHTILERQYKPEQVKIGVMVGDKGLSSKYNN